jgi:hypothetical protein
MEREFGRLARTAYIGARDGTLDWETAFDLASTLTSWGDTDPVLRELAELSIEGTSHQRMTDLTRHVLAQRFEPGFDLEPGLLAPLEEALETVKADMQAIGLPGPIRLVIPEWSDPPHAFVEFRGNGYGSTAGIGPGAGPSPTWALLAVADEAQGSIMETLWEAWPLCPIHQLGGHVQEHDGTAVWRCTGNEGHTIAPIGHWEQARPPA